MALDLATRSSRLSRFRARYPLPRVLHWFTGNIGYHHIHHLDPRVPFYCLPACHTSTHLFDGVTHLRLIDTMHSLRLKLWDGARLITFAEAHHRTGSADD